MNELSTKPACGWKSTAAAAMLCLGLSGCAALAPVPDQFHATVPEFAPLPLPHCQESMDDPEYWLSRFPNRNQTLLSSRQIERLNQENYTRKFLSDVFSPTIGTTAFSESVLPGAENPECLGVKTLATEPAALNGYTLYTFLKEETEHIKSQQRWDEEGNTITAEKLRAWDENLNVHAIRETNLLRYGITLSRTDMRYYPTTVFVKRRPDYDPVDLLQVSSVPALSPVAIMHISRDQEWVFAASPFCCGWISRKDIIEDCSPQELKPFVQPEKFVVITGHAVEALAAPGNTQTAAKLYMGEVYPLLETAENYFALGVPAKTKANGIQTKTIYLPADADVHVGFLACTPRSICEQAFKLLHTPYSWGGRGEYRDCSQLVMDVYATMGLKLPRNSGTQAKVGSARRVLAGSGKAGARAAILDSLQQPALLQFPGHIMLYLGHEGDYYYAIHDILSFRVQDKPDADRRMFIGKVVVSDLSLGEGSTHGSLLERITSINPLQP